MSVKILLIEDNPDHLEITKRILERTGEDYQVDCVMDPHEGLKRIFEGSYDVILCDYRLPDLSAFDVLKEMNNKGKDIPFIVISALGSEKVAVEMMKEGAYDYIVKDISYSDTLNVVIKKTIDRYRNKKEKERLEQEIREAYEELKQTQDQLIQAEKLNAVGQLASGVAHEVRNPLGIILQGINYLETRISAKEDDIVDTLAMLKDGIKRADKIINALLDFSRATSLDLQPEDINAILEVSLSLIKSQLELKGVKVVMKPQPGISMAIVDKNKIEQVFINILLNAIQAMPTSGEIIIRTYEKQLDEPRNGIGRRKEDYFQPGEKAVIVEFEDTGAGISEENLNKIFDPFFTTRGPKGGVGLGLSVSRNIVNMHKGLICAESRVGKGTKITVILKMAERR